MFIVGLIMAAMLLVSGQFSISYSLGSSCSPSPVVHSVALGQCDNDPFSPRSIVILRCASCSSNAVDVAIFSGFGCLNQPSFISGLPYSSCVTSQSSSFFVFGNFGFCQSSQTNCSIVPVPTVTPTPSGSAIVVGNLTATQLSYIICGSLYALSIIVSVIVLMCYIFVTSLEAPSKSILSAARWMYALGFFIPGLDCGSVMLVWHSHRAGVPVKWRSKAASGCGAFLGSIEFLLNLVLWPLCFIFDFGYAGSTIQNALSPCYFGSSSCIVWPMPPWLFLVAFPSIVFVNLSLGIPRMCMMNSMAKGAFGGERDDKDGSSITIDLSRYSSQSNMALEAAIVTGSIDIPSEPGMEMEFVSRTFACLVCGTSVNSDLSVCESCKIDRMEDAVQVTTMANILEDERPEEPVQTTTMANILEDNGDNEASSLPAPLVFCPSCGTRTEPPYKFCSDCGHNL